MVWLTKQNFWSSCLVFLVLADMNSYATTAKPREVHISTATWGQTHHKGIEIPGLTEDAGDMDEQSFQTKRKLAYLPAYGMSVGLVCYHNKVSGGSSTKVSYVSYSIRLILTYVGTTHWLTYKRTWMSVSRTRHDPRDAWSRKEDTIQIR